MTATKAGEPAMDPDDTGIGAPGAGAEAAGDLDASRLDDPRLTGQRLDGPDLPSGRIAALHDRLASPMPQDGIWGWLGPLLVTAFAAFFRFNRLSVPHALIFDETYYAKDAWSILRHGVEWNLVPKANDIILSGGTHIFQGCTGTGCGEYVVQPPVGKLAIAAGEWIYGRRSKRRKNTRKI